VAGAKKKGPGKARESDPLRSAGQVAGVKPARRRRAEEASRALARGVGMRRGRGAKKWSAPRRGGEALGPQVRLNSGTFAPALRAAAQIPRADPGAGGERGRRWGTRDAVVEAP
jgi:hypothetical protein